MRQDLNWKQLVRAGLIAGIVTLYTCLVGMMVAFTEREIIRETITLGQILLVMASSGAGFLIARGLTKAGNILLPLVAGSIVGLISTVPLLILIFLAEPLDIQAVLVNVNRDLMEILTFAQDDPITGSLLLVGVMTISGIIGAGFFLIPARLRRALATGVICILLVGMLSELVQQILDSDLLQQVFGQFLTRDNIRTIFIRDALTTNAAIGIFAIATGLSLTWGAQKTALSRRAAGLSIIQQRNLQRGGLSLLGIILLLLPWLIGTAASDVLVNVGLYILMGLGLNMAIGLAGLLDLGYVTNFAVGAYVMGVLTSTGPLGVGVAAGVTTFNFWLVIPISLLIAMLTGLLLAVPVLRMRGDYLAIATLGFGEIIRLLAISDWLKPLIGGAQGILFIPKPEIFGIVLNDPQQIYYILLAACLLAIFVSTRLNNSRIGRQWMAIREDEDVAAAMGIDTARSKLLAFTLSAATGGVAGAIFASKLGTIFPNSFSLQVSINVLSLIIVGGMGSVPGVVVGALVLIGLPELLREFDEFRLLLYGVLLVVMMLARPEGLWPSAVRRREIHTAEDEPEVVPEPKSEASPVVAGD
jgi:branched-chain amino acid transport system permease protein